MRLGFVRLGILAALACEAVGRSYLASSDQSIERMVQVLKSKPLAPRWKAIYKKKLMFLEVINLDS